MATDNRFSGDDVDPLDISHEKEGSDHSGDLPRMTEEQQISNVSGDPNIASGGKKSKIPDDVDEDDVIEITEEDCEGELGFSYPSWKKWMILTVIFIVQVSMNFNTSLYSNGLGGISKQFHVSEQAARVGAAIFLITYAFGCELWAPW
jgi:hypothetical protein